MDHRAKAVMEECTRASDEERISFPQVVMELMSAGVERYHADLHRHEKTYYMPDGASHVIVTKPTAGEIAPSFSPPDVEAAIRDIQARRITYRQFCARIRAGGCVGYIVSLVGRRAVYFGRSGECHVEHFPPVP